MNNTIMILKPITIYEEEWKFKDFLTPFEPDLDLLPFWFGTDDFSLACFFAVPVTTSYIVGRSLIIVNRRFLYEELHLITDQDATNMYICFK